MSRAQEAARLVEVDVDSGSNAAGHIPTGLNIPWWQAVNEPDGTFKSVDEPDALYGERGMTADREVITYQSHRRALVTLLARAHTASWLWQCPQL